MRYDEVVEEEAIRHAVRFTVQKSRKAYVAPARHQAGRGAEESLPPMGMRVRLKASVEAGKFSGAARTIVEALKIYGMILADNGGDWIVSGTPDARWKDVELETLKRLKGSDFEVVKMGAVSTP